MGILSRIFGQSGVVRFKATTFHDTFFEGKCSIETFGMSNEEVEDELKKMVFVEKGIRVKELKIIGFYES